MASRSRKTLGFLALVSLLVAPPVFSDESTDEKNSVSSSDQKDLADLSLDSLMNQEVVYAASKSEQRTSEAPGSTTIVTYQEIKAQGFRSLDDLLRYTRGFFITYDRDYTYVGLRGFGSLGGFNSRILLLIDGHRMNDNIYGQFYTGEDAAIDMDMVDHVEIIRGPASALYGSSAVFGVVNVVTKKGKAVEGVALSAQGGSLNTIKGGILYGGHSDSGWQWTLQGSAFSSGGNASLYYPEYDDPSTNNGFTLNSDGEQSEHAYFALLKDDWSLKGAFMHRKKTVPTGVYDTNFNDPNTFTDDTTIFTELAYDHGDPETSHWSGRVYLDVSDYWGHYVPAGGGVSNIDIGNGAWWGSEIQYTFSPFPLNKLTLGGEFVDNFEEYQKNYDVAVNLDVTHQATERALYVQDEMKIFSNLILNLGGRYDEYSTAGGQWIPRGALIWEPTNATTLKLLAGQAFRNPSPFELYYNDGGISQEPNPDLKTETFQTYEFDLEQAFLKDHRVIASFFRYTGGNLILGTLDPSTSLLVYQNIGRFSVNGVEVEYLYLNPNGIQGRLSWACQRAQDDLTGDVLPDSPQQLAKASLQVPVIADHLTVAGECQFTGASYGFTGAWAGDYTVFNLKLYSPHFFAPNLEASLAAYNLFDQRYYQPVSNALQQQTLQQDGLVLWARLGYRI